MKLDKTMDTNHKYVLYNKNTGEKLWCEEFGPMKRALRYNYTSGYWTAEHDVVTNHSALIKCYNDLMAHS